MAVVRKSKMLEKRGYLVSMSLSHNVSLAWMLARKTE